MSAALQLELPFTGGELARRPVKRAVVEVVVDGERARVRPVDLPGWVRFPRRLREPGASFVVDELRPLPGGAWAAVGRITRVARRRGR